MAHIITQRSGKGNRGMYIDRFPRICSAGVPSAQPELCVANCFNYYLFEDHQVEPKKEATQISQQNDTKHSKTEDMRNAGPFSEGSQLINPPVKTKFQTLVEDFKDTVYTSYWNRQIGKGIDSNPFFPPNIDIKNTTFGKSTMPRENMRDVFMSNEPRSEETSTVNDINSQKQRNYCKTSFNPNAVFGKKSYTDRNGKLIKCCLSDEKVNLGTSLKNPLVTAQVNFQQRTRADLGICLTPNRNIDQVPKGFTFGTVEAKDNIVGCFTTCEMNPNRELFKKCLAHLNTVRKCLSKRFEASFFLEFYLKLKYWDIENSGWLSKNTVYEWCTKNYIRFNPKLIEPLLSLWKAINDSHIKYDVFVNVINFREPLPHLPKVWDIPPECTDFNTTYMEMVRPQEMSKTCMAGVPSGRYLDKHYPVTPDGYCKADRSYLPHESDAKSCLCPSIFTLLGISHRDMYAPRDFGNIKSVFESAGLVLNSDKFNEIWNEANKRHSRGFVSYETFRQTLKTFNNEDK